MIHNILILASKLFLRESMQSRIMELRQIAILCVHRNVAASLKVKVGGFFDALCYFKENIYISLKIVFAFLILSLKRIFSVI